MLQLKIHFNYHTYAMYMYLRDVHTVLFSTYDVLKQKPDQIRMYLN